MHITPFFRLPIPVDPLFPVTLCMALSRLLLLPFLLIALTGLYLGWEVDSSWTSLLIGGVLGGTVIYVLSPQIDWWWAVRHPPDLDPQMHTLLLRVDPTYRALSRRDQLRFRQRVALFLMGHAFMPQGWEEVPYDVQVIIGVGAIKARKPESEVLYPHCERIVVYPTAFPSPAHPQDWHHSEWFPEDGVALFAADAVLTSWQGSAKVLDLALYEYCRIQAALHPHPEVPEDDLWAAIKQLTGWELAILQEWIGIPEVDPAAVLLSRYHRDPEATIEALPDWREWLAFQPA